MKTNVISACQGLNRPHKNVMNLRLVNLHTLLKKAKMSCMF